MSFTIVLVCRGRLKCDGTHTETSFCLSAKQTSPFRLAGASVQLTTGSRGVHISSSNAGYTMFRGSAKGTGYPLHSPVSSSLPVPCITMCHHISAGVYLIFTGCIKENLQVPIIRNRKLHWVFCLLSNNF